jgi:DNA-binding FrmR family transcriptional regulator
MLKKQKSRERNHTPSHALHVDIAVKENMLLRLRRVEGQVRGIQKMVEDQRYCPDVLTQMSAIHESLRSVERILMKNHLKHCATEALRSGDENKAQKTYDELTELFYRHAR